MPAATATDAVKASRRERLRRARFYGIFDLAYAPPERAEDFCKQMLAGGVDVIQLRAKGSPEAEVAALAARLQPVVAEQGGLFIVNDWPNVARSVQADGVHLGQDDLSVAAARGLLAPGQLVGKSTHSLAQARAAAVEMPDYIGVGPLYATATKPDYQPVGLELIGQVNADPSVAELPRFCIGGVKLKRLPEILGAGAERVVIVSALLLSDDLTAYARGVRVLLDS
ncbi:MAG: thiamine phosphate synthase [Verrucomicrobiota bacterium]